VQNPEDYFDPDQLPEGVTLLNPSKMKDPQIQELLQFWHSRQENGDTGVGFQLRSDPNKNPWKRVRHDSEPSSSPPPDEKRRQMKGKQKQVLTWQDYIEPDSRQRWTRYQSVLSDASGEAFDFGPVDQLDSTDEENGPVAGPSTKLSGRNKGELYLAMTVALITKRLVCSDSQEGHGTKDKGTDNSENKDNKIYGDWQSHYLTEYAGTEKQAREVGDGVC
jgi:hypothetical protein